MKVLTKKTFLAFAAAGVLLLSACGSRSAQGSSADSAAVSEDAGYEPAYNGLSYTDDMKAEQAADYDSETSSRQTELSSEKMVYRGSVSIQTKDYKESVSKIRQRVSEFGGIIESEEEYSDSGYNYDSETKSLWTLSATVRIPTEKFNEFLNGTSDIGNVISRSSGAENISRVYSDVSVQIEALEKQQTRLLEMMDQAKTIEDMIAVEDRLSEVQYELNSLKTRLAAMDTDVAYSTVNIWLREVRVYTETSDSFTDKLASSFTSGWANFLDCVEGIVLGAVYLLPLLIIIGVIIAVLAKKKVFSRIFRKNKE